MPKLLLVLYLLVQSQTLFAQQKEVRVALVIGNSAYKQAPLRNPVNDARDMAVRLRSLGFTVIERDDVLGVGFVRLRVPPGQSLKAALAVLEKLGGEVSADQLHLPSGSGAPIAVSASDARSRRSRLGGAARSPFPKTNSVAPTRI